MTNVDYTAILMIVDRSGSMQPIRAAAEEAVNGFITGQQELPGRCTVRLHEFDDVVNVVTPSTDVHGFPPYRLSPRGTTALLDAIGSGVADFGAELASLPEDERPGKVIVVIQTDGMENASKTYSVQDVSTAIAHQRDVYGWNVVFLGANIDAVATAANLGIPAGSALTYAATNSGTRAAGDVLSSYVTTTRSGGTAAFSDADRADVTR